MSEIDDQFTKCFVIPDENMVQLNKRLFSMAKKAKKLGFPDIRWQSLDSYTKDIKGHRVLFNTVEVSGQQPVLSGWSFLGKLEHMTDGGTLVNSVGDSKIPKHYWDCEPDCDHCQTTRNRKHSFILKNNDSQEYKQVGGACLEDFLNNENPHNAAKFLEMLIDLDDSFADLLEDCYEPGENCPLYVPVLKVLELA